MSGLDGERVGAWLVERCGLVGPVRITPVPGGRSNLTSVVTDAQGRRVVVRRPPLGALLDSAHDVLREGRILSALAGSGVPVPAVLGSEADPAVTGAPFVVMEHVEGTVVRDTTVAATLEPELRTRIGHDAVRTLAQLHALDVDALGLGDLARRDGYLRRQLTRWSMQLEAGGVRALPDLSAVAARLGDRLPEQQRVVLVHGDYRLDNLLVDVEAEEGRSVRAVLDWELATLGDPLADLGTLLAYWGRPATSDDAPGVGVLPGLPTALRGFPSPEEVVATYAAASATSGAAAHLTGTGAGSAGSDLEALVERLRPYVAFALFRIACILEGVRIRSLAGAYGTLDVTQASEVALLEDRVPDLGAQALAVLGSGPPLGWGP
jgi:aminoglycoside phosphotransferase (APT) family kinase protein